MNTMNIPANMPYGSRWTHSWATEDVNAYPPQCTAFDGNGVEVPYRTFRLNIHSGEIEFYEDPLVEEEPGRLKSHTKTVPTPIRFAPITESSHGRLSKAGA